MIRGPPNLIDKLQKPCDGYAKGINLSLKIILAIPIFII